MIHGATVVEVLHGEEWCSVGFRAECLTTGAVHPHYVGIASNEAEEGAAIVRALRYLDSECARAVHVMEHDRAATPTKETAE